MPKITFVTATEERVVESTVGEDLFTTAVRVGIRTGGVCGGRGVCGLCRVTILTGVENINPPNVTEEAHIGSATRLLHERLACQVIPTGEVGVRI